MAREKELFRDNLERLDMAFPGKEVLSKKEAAGYLGIQVETFNKYFYREGDYGISKVRLASLLS